ncbi:MAG: hypothetical protein WCS03_07090 [Bacteroidota bacterium]
MKRIIVTFIAILSILLSHSGCSKEEHYNQPALDDLYQSAVADAIMVDSSEICDTLWPITSGNSKLEWETINNEKYVLVGNFNKYPDSYSDTSVINSWGMIWVFIPEQYISRMKSTLNQQSDTLLRMSQLLGLPPGNNNNYIVELWVKPEDLFRPSADPEIDDKTAGQYLPANASADYVKWFNQNIYDSYFGIGTHYPWTRLGYTYDWAKTGSEVGVSEFCIKTNSLVYVEKLYVALKYLNN